MMWMRTALALLGGLAVGALFGNACVLQNDDCNCREPQPLVRGTFRVTEVTSRNATEAELAPLRTATLTIAEDAVVIEYERDGAPARATYAIANKHDLMQ
jgi:hypothetical protein